MGENNTDLPAINEIAYFLNEFAPSAVAELASRGNEYAELLKIGVFGGKQDDIEDFQKTASLRVRTEILTVALQEVVSAVDERTERTRTKLKALRSLQFFGNVCSMVGAMGAAGTAILDKQTATVVLSLFSLASNIASAAASTLVLGRGKKESELVECLQDLARGRSFAILTAKYLAAAKDHSFPVSELAILVKEANAQYRELSDLLAKSAI